MDPFLFLLGEAFASNKPNQSFDFSQTHTNSDLDTTFVEAGLEGRFEIRSDLYLAGGYRYLDFEDDAPYLGDDTGSVDFFSLRLGWKF